MEPSGSPFEGQDQLRTARTSTRQRPPVLLTVVLALLAGILLYRLAYDYGLIPSASPRAITARGELADDEKATIELFQQCSPSVVYITNMAVRSDGFRLNVSEVPQGTGSGFIWDERGHVVTNFHVIQDADALRVTLNDHSTWNASIAGTAPDKDLVVLRIDAPPARLRPIAVGTSKNLLVGQKVFAIGNPFGLDQTLTTGIVSALGRTILSVTRRKIEDVIQTDAAINPGNSGGPLLDSAGRLVGVNTAIFSPTGSSAGIGFAVPVDTVNSIIPELIAHGKITRPKIGVYLAHDGIARQMGVKGVLVLDVEPGSGAAEAGLRPTRRSADGDIVLGDVIQAVDGQAVAGNDDLMDILDKYQVGSAIEVTVRRGETTLKLDVRLQ